MWVEGISEFDLRAVDCQLRARNLCRKLTELLFSEEELKNGNATEARTSGVSLLDSHRLYAIRGNKTYCISCQCIDKLTKFSLPFPFLQFTASTGSQRKGK